MYFCLRDAIWLSGSKLVMSNEANGLVQILDQIFWRKNPILAPKIRLKLTIYGGVGTFPDTTTPQYS